MTAPLNRIALNPQQQAAVDHDGSRLMIIAGAGTGKTATVAARAARLIRDGLLPHSIWLITFTTAAADELRQRACGCVKDGDLIAAGTYHALAVRLLRRWGALIDWQGEDILDSSDQLALIKQLIAALKLSLPDVKPRLIADFFSFCSNSSRSFEDVAAAGTFRRLAPHLGILYLLQSAYHHWKQDHGYADYDDLLYGLLELISSAGGRVLADCRHLMVDEYQDTSPLQQQVLEAILAHGIGCTVVGDPMQAVYSWRGCDPQLMARREGWDVLTLDRNYRSPQPVLDLACRVVADQSSVRLRSGIAGRPVPPVQVLPTEEAEARHVLDHVQRLLASGVPSSEIAVLYRKGVHALRLEVALTAADVPYVKHGGRRLTEAAHVKDMLALLRLGIGDHQHSLCRVLQLMPGVGLVTATKMAENPGWAGSEFCSKVELFVAVQACIRKMRMALTPADAYAAALAWYAPVARLEPHRLKELEQLGQSCASASGLRAWLDGLTLDSAAPAADRKGIILSTVHTAKGKEWRHVIIIRCAKGLFPQSEDDPEEMRLLHIAMTRSAEQLLICRPAFAQFPDSGWRYCCTPSVLQ